MDEQFAQRVFDECPTRFRRNEKNKLLLLLRERFGELGYDSTQIRTLKHRGLGHSHNFVVGRPDARYVFTAHYDTPGKTGFLLFSAPFLGQTGGNILFLLLSFVLFLGAAFGGIKLVDLARKYFLDESAPFILSVLIYIAPILLLLIIFLSTMFIRNKTNRNDNTSGVLGLIALAEIISKDKVMRENSCFVFFDNEEWGLLGSASYSSWLKANGYDISRAVVVNLDCIGEGDRIAVVSTGGRNKLAKYLKLAFAEKGIKIIKKRSIMIYMSDHASLSGAVMISKVRRSTLGPVYIPHIHTSKDVNCDIDGINTLAAQLYDMVSSIE